MGDPALSVVYNVTVDGFISLGTWKKIEGLGFEYQVTEYREGGVNGYMHKLAGPRKYTNLRMSRPVDSDSMLISIWLASMMVAVVPQTMAITAMTAAGEDITTWNLVGAIPVKWTGPTLDIMSNQIAMETIEIAYEDIIGLGALGGAIAGALTMSASVSF
jgi:phage tail-like protein